MFSFESVYEIPEHAIRSFEKTYGLRVTVHDIAGSLWAFLEPERFMHMAPVCQAVKARGGQTACLEFESRKLRAELPQMPNGRVHVCHAGLLEWVVPVYEGMRLAWVIFAGPRLAGRTLTGVPAQRLSQWRIVPGSDSDVPKTVEADEAEMILEHLRQLAARLVLWARSVEEIHAGAQSAHPDANAIVQRQTIIRRFIASYHTGTPSLKDLASLLFLSESRTSHVVQECCGAPFRDLLLEARLRTAMGLLRHSSAPVTDVAMMSGFRDVAHFHRVFRRKTEMSPSRFRKYAGS